MLRRISKDNDLDVQIPYLGEYADKITVEYYTDGEYKYSQDIEAIDEEFYAITIPSTELAKMNEGQLHSTITLKVKDNSYPDNYKNNSTNSNFDIWIQ